MNPGRGLVVRTFAPRRPNGVRDDPDDHAVRILAREGDHPAAIAFAQARVDSHPDASASKIHWIRVTQVLRGMHQGKKVGDHRTPPSSGLPIRDGRPTWPCARQDGGFIEAHLTKARPGNGVAIRCLKAGRLTYVVEEITAVSRGLARVTVGVRAFHIRSGRPVDPIPGRDERLVTVTASVRAFAADYPVGRESRLLRQAGSPT